MYNKPNKYFSNMIHMPTYFTPLLLITVPISIIYRSKRINRAINIFIYIIKLFLPYIFIYWALNLMLIPFNYIKILYCIVFQKYTN